MKEKMQLIFDFDDTIVSTNIEFEKTNMQTATIISSALFGSVVEVNRIVAKQREIDIQMVKKHGFVRPRFLMSWLETYQVFCNEQNREPDEKIKRIIEETVNDIYVRKYELIPGSLETIESLKKEGYPIIILTAGENEIQERKVKESGVRDIVDQVHVYSFKTPSTLKEVMNQYPNRQDYAMIGNSAKSDIMPALENNIYGFHFERKTWEADDWEINKNHPKYVHLPIMPELPTKLEGILLQESVK